MAHRKLQQEIDRVFKKITEGLDIFNTFHERHEHASNASQKDKLENDLKREIKKLQKLREQIKVWQTSNDVKDKDKLLEYRRLVEVAMEQYKVIEKGSKVKAYSNTSLKANNELDPEEKEKLECINFIQDSIDELESQYQNCEVELDKLNSKKSKKVSASVESKKEELKEFQSKYRWHQQNLELALRLLENGELVVDDINEIKEDLNYFLTSNRDPSFIDNEYLYESLDLDSNEILQHEVVTSFNGLNEKEASPGPDDIAPDTGAPVPAAPVATAPVATAPVSTVPVPTAPTSLPPSISPSPNISQAEIKEVPKIKKLVTSSSSSGLTSSLKPALTPVKPAQPDIKWSSLVAGLEKETTPSTPTTIIQPVEPVISKINDSDYLNDSTIISLPPGIQDIILSFYSNRIENNSMIGSHRIKNVSNLLNSKRYFLNNNVLINYSKDLSLEFQKCLNEWNKIKNYLNLSDLESSKILSNLELSTLFYNYFFSLTPFESLIIAKELNSRGWKLLNDGKSWVNEVNKFDIENWNLTENFDKEKPLVW